MEEVGGGGVGGGGKGRGGVERRRGEEEKMGTSANCSSSISPSLAAQGTIRPLASIGQRDNNKNNKASLSHCLTACLLLTD